MTYKVGDRVTVCGTREVEVTYGPVKSTFDRYVMYVVREDGGTERTVKESDLSSAPRVFGKGDRVKSLRESYTVEAGPFDGIGGDWYAVKADEGKVYSSGGMYLTLVSRAPEAEAPDVETYYDIVYDLTATYRDRDGDIWRFARFGGAARGEYGGSAPSENSSSLWYAVDNYGPLTKV
ncbi:phiSA1p31-related protein [Streptomyces sp. H27-H1]|uniref:phiSA1p31-related protein n=1 Tax=Streptomyces sp. H27-H1 TaxID=2996461 RepID=UPI00226F6FDD|nr:phiSA1p31-related protein [Streptomyces sp. H27-H1]MCY0926254.1 phiSA1p31-related protein [Streptomyces sp. H27-H1]